MKWRSKPAGMLLMATCLFASSLGFCCRRRRDPIGDVLQPARSVRKEEPKVTELNGNVLTQNGGTCLVNAMCTMIMAAKRRQARENGQMMTEEDIRRDMTALQEKLEKKYRKTYKMSGGGANAQFNWAAGRADDEGGFSLDVIYGWEDVLQTLSKERPVELHLSSELTSRLEDLDTIAKTRAITKTDVMDKSITKEDAERIKGGGSGHVVVLVPDQERLEAGVLVLKNSWGEDWAQNGFMHIEVDALSALCGDTKKPYPTISEVIESRNEKEVDTAKCLKREPKVLDDQNFQHDGHHLSTHSGFYCTELLTEHEVNDIIHQHNELFVEDSTIQMPTPDIQLPSRVRVKMSGLCGMSRGQCGDVLKIDADSGDVQVQFDDAAGPSMVGVPQWIGRQHLHRLELVASNATEEPITMKNRVGKVVKADTMSDECLWKRWLPVKVRFEDANNDVDVWPSERHAITQAPRTVAGYAQQ